MTRNLVVGACLAAACALSACGDQDDSVKIIVFQAAPDAIEAGQSTKLVFAVDPADARLTLTEIGDVTGKTEAKVTPSATTTYQLTAVRGKATTNQQVKVTVGPVSAVALKVEAASATPTAGVAVPITITALAASGKPAPGFRGTVALTSTDGAAVLPADLVFTANDAGVKVAAVTLKTAGVSALTATDTSVKLGLTGSTSMTVQPAAAASYQLSALPNKAAAGESVVLSVTVRDAFGNVVTGYGGDMRVVSTDPSDVLPVAGKFIAGVRTVSLTFTKAGNHAAQVEDVAVVLPSAPTTSVAVGAGPPFKIAVSTASATTTAGAPASLSAVVVDVYDNVCTTYAGTVAFTATDPQAALPADFTFGAGDQGAHDFDVTLKTAGSIAVALHDAANAIDGAASWTVGAAAAASCIASQAPDTTAAGTVIGLTVTARDPFGNAATGYAGTVALTASDNRANLPAPVTYLPGSDAGSHAFPVALLTTGPQTVTATDVVDPAITCSAGISVTPGPAKLVLGVPANTNAGYALDVTITVKDVFDNAIPNYAGTVSFTSSDGGTGAVTPSPVTFDPSQGGVATTSATFVTTGTQTLSASDAGAPVATGSAAAAVHGLQYTAPNTGRVRLVANAAASSAQVIQLDLVANERLELSTFFGGGPGSFSAGMNLPLDTTRVGADGALFAVGNALPLGAGPQAAKGAIGPDHVLYAAVSRKRVAGAIFSQVTEVQAGQVFYSVRLKLLQAGTVGPVFDGAQPMALYRAGVRDQWGDDFVGQADFGVGKLEIH